MATKRLTKATLQSELQRRVRTEAKALGLTQKEYLRLTLAVSKALRESFGDVSGVQLKALLGFVESPMFSVLLRGIVKTALSSVDSPSTSEGEDPSQETAVRSEGTTRMAHPHGIPTPPMGHPRSAFSMPRRELHPSFQPNAGGPLQGQGSVVPRVPLQPFHLEPNANAQPQRPNTYPGPQPQHRFVQPQQYPRA